MLECVRKSPGRSLSFKYGIGVEFLSSAEDVRIENPQAVDLRMRVPDKEETRNCE